MGMKKRASPSGSPRQIKGVYRPAAQPKKGIAILSGAQIRLNSPHTMHTWYRMISDIDNPPFLVDGYSVARFEGIVNQ